MTSSQLTVVWHCCCGWDWAPIVREQLNLAARCGLHTIHGTHLGEGRDVVQRWAVERGISLTWESSDPNLAHYETHAMLLVERLARWNDGATMYWHTKGVSCPGSELHRRWRALMQLHVIQQWEHLLPNMDAHDVAGVCWGFCFSRPHYPGNFWLARNDYLRTLPPFAAYHGSLGLSRYTCETWVGEGKPRVLSLLGQDRSWEQIIATWG